LDLRGIFIHEEFENGLEIGIFREKLEIGTRGPSSAGKVGGEACCRASAAYQPDTSLECVDGTTLKASISKREPGIPM
jgi:hypothetical protein